MLSSTGPPVGTPLIPYLRLPTLEICTMRHVTDQNDGAHFRSQHSARSSSLSICLLITISVTQIFIFTYLMTTTFALLSLSDIFSKQTSVTLPCSRSKEKTTLLFSLFLPVSMIFRLVLCMPWWIVPERGSPEHRDHQNLGQIIPGRCVPTLDRN